MSNSSAVRFTDKEKDEVWQRWKSGESLSAIGNILGRKAPSIYHVLSKYGGVKRFKRKRSKNHLSLNEREEISRGIAQNKSFRVIAKELKQAPSSISREVSRNGGIHKYRACTADDKAWKRAKRPKLCKLQKKSRTRIINS